MRNSENSSTRSKLAALTRIGLLVLIFAVVFATVLSCGAFGESATLNNGSVENVAEAGTWGTTGSVDISGSAHQYTVSVGSSSQTINGASSLYSTYQSLRIAQGNATATIKVSLDEVDFTNKVSVSNAEHSVTGYQIGTGSFGGRSSSNSIGSPGTGIATNVAVPSQIMAFINAGYTVTVSWTVGNYMTYNGNSATRDIGLRVSSTMTSGENARAGQGVTWLDCGNGFTEDGTWNGFDDRTTTAATLSAASTYVGLCIIRGGGMWRYPGMAVKNMYLTFSIAKGSASDGTGPSFSNVDIEGDGFDGLTIPSGESQVGSAYTNNKGTYNYSASSRNYELGMVTGGIIGKAGGVSYYKSMSMDISDGNPTSVAFYHGIKSATLSSTDGVSATAAASASSGGSANASNGLFRVEIDKITESGTKSAVRVYFAANGTYTLSLYDNGSVFGGNDNHTDITIVVSGIDVTAPSGSDIGGSAPGNGTADLGQLASAPWNTAGVATAAINGKPDSDTGSAWVYYFDVRYSFFPFTSAPTSDTSAITNGTAYPIAITNAKTAVNFTYNTSSGAMSVQIGTEEPYDLTVAQPLSGTKVFGKSGYYAFMIYVADMAGNVQSKTPFVYYVKVDTTGISGQIGTSYYYDTDGSGAGRTDATDWVNKYMVGDNGFVYTDISFTLNPSGNIITFNYGGNYAGITESGNKYDFTAVVAPVNGKVTVDITGNGDPVQLTGDEAKMLVEGAAGQAALYASVALSGSDSAGYTVTLTLSYRRAADTEFGINHTTSITVKPRGLKTETTDESGTTTRYIVGGDDTVATSASSTVKVDTLSIQDIAFSDAGGYLTAGVLNPEEGQSSFEDINTGSVAGRKWYTNDAAITLSATTGAYDIYEYMLMTDAEYAKYKTYFGWRNYNSGDVNAAVADGITAFKAAMAEAEADNNLVAKFTEYFGAYSEDESLSQSYSGHARGQLLSSPTVNIHFGDNAGVRVLYIMTLDQAGNANFAVYRVLVDTTTYALTFEVDAAYLAQFSALNNVSFSTTIYDGTATATVRTTFKRGENIAVEVKGLAAGYVPYTVSKYITDKNNPIEFYNQNNAEPLGMDYSVEGFIPGTITAPEGGDYASGKKIAFMLDRAGNLGMIGTTGSDLGLIFTFRKSVNLSTNSRVDYSGRPVTETSNLITATSTAELSGSEQTAIRQIAYGKMKWNDANGSPVVGAPVNAGTYTLTSQVIFEDQPFYISDEIMQMTLTVSKRALNLSGIVGTWSGGTYGDVKKGAFGALSDDTLGAKTLAEILGVADADLGQDNGKTLANILSGSGYILVNNNEVDGDAFNAYFAASGNLNAGTYTIKINSACTAANYTVSLDLSFVVDKAKLNITATGGKTYGEADGQIEISVGNSTALRGDDITAVFPGLDKVGSSTITVYLPAGTSAARNYTYEGQGNDAYADAGPHKFTALNIPSSNISANFVIDSVTGDFVVSQLNVYAIPDPDQVITTLTGYSIKFQYYDAAADGKVITAARITDQIVPGTFVSATEFNRDTTVYNVAVEPEFSVNGDNIVIHAVVDGITITLDYDWDKKVITISFAEGFAPKATYMVNFDNTLLNYADGKFAYTTSVTAAGGETTITSGLPEGFTISWTGGSLKDYDATSPYGTSFGVELEGIKLMNGAEEVDITSDAAEYSVVVGATVSVDYLHVTLTPIFTGTSKVYGDADNWTYSVPASVADGVELVDDTFLEKLVFTGEIVRALYSADGTWLRNGLNNDSINELLTDGQYYAAYCAANYECPDDSSVEVDPISADVLKAIKFTITPRLISESDIIEKVGVNKEVPNGADDVPYGSVRPLVLGNVVLDGDDVFIAYTSAVYVKKAVEGVRPEFTEDELSAGGIYNLDIKITGLSLAGAAAGNYKLSDDMTAADYFVLITSENENEFYIAAFQFEGILSGDVLIEKTYDATKVITDSNFVLSGVLADIRDQFGSSFFVLGRRYGSFDYRMELRTSTAGNYIVDAAFFVEGLSEVSFIVDSNDFDVANWTYVKEGEPERSGVVILVYNVETRINRLAFGLDKVDIKPGYEGNKRYYNGSELVDFEFVWKSGIGLDTTVFSSNELNALAMQAYFSVASKNAGKYTGIKVSEFDFNSNSNLVPSFDEEDIALVLKDVTVEILPIPIDVTFVFKTQYYGATTTELDGSYKIVISDEYYFAGSEDELKDLTISASGATFTFWDADSDKAYPYVQYSNGQVRLHDIKYTGVTFTSSNGVANLVNYTFQGNALSAGSEGVLREVAPLNPALLDFDLNKLQGISKEYDGNKDANAAFSNIIDGLPNGLKEVLKGLIGEGDDADVLDITFDAVFDGYNVSNGGRMVTVNNIVLTADEGYEQVAASYALTKTSLLIQRCSITQAPLQVTFTLPTKTYDGDRYIDSVDGDVYYELGGEYGDFKTDDDRRRYRVTFLAAAYTDANASDVVDGYFIGVELVASSSTTNYYLVDAEGNKLAMERFFEEISEEGHDDARYLAKLYDGTGFIYSDAGGSLEYAVITATGKIEKAVYTVTVADTLTKEFDNTDAYNGDLSAIRFTVSGLADTSGITITGATFASANAGTWDVTFTLGYTGTDPNYTVSPTAVAKGVITKRTLTVSLADADFVYGFGGSAPVYADRLVYSVSIADTDYAVVVQGGVAYITKEGYKALTGADADPPSETDTVTDDAGVKYYALNGKVGDVTLTSAAFRQTNGKWVGVGDYDVTAIAGSADNFVLTLATGQKVNVVRAELTVSAKGDYEYVVDTAIADLKAKVLGELMPDGITNGDVFASAVSGIKVSFGGLTVNSAPAAKFAITVNVADATSANYTLAAGADTYYVTVVLPALSVTAKSGQSSIYDGTDRLDDADFLAALVNRKTDGVKKAYTFEVVDEEADFAIKNAGNYAFDIKVTCKYTGLEEYTENNGAYATTATVSVAYDVNKAALTISRSGKIATIYYTAKAQKLTDYDGFFAFEGAVEAEVEAMLDALATSVTYTSGSATAAKTFTNAGAYEVALNATEGVFANYNVTSGVTLLNVRKAPVNVNGTVTEGDIGSDAKFGVTVTGVVPAEGCPVDAATVGKLTTTTSYSSGATTVAEITEAGVYNYVITLSDPVNYEIVSGGTLGASGTVTVTVKVVTENDSETAEKKAEVVFETPQTRAWTLSSYELAESNSTYIAYSSEAAKLAGTGETVEIGGVVRLELVSGTTTINATTTSKLGETVEITVKLPSALSSGTSGYTIYERQKDGSLKEVSDYVVNDGYFTYNSDLISDLVFVRIVGSGVPFWIWILVAVLAALIILAIILAAFIGRKDRSTTPPPAAPPAEPPVEDAPVSHDGALPAADVDIDIPDAPAHIGGGDRPPLIGTR